ncbi:MAG: hypothetical protein IJY90_00595 [Clostridia bacterium]|nr:hypothetical protein [Clostridia bacterium]
MAKMKVAEALQLIKEKGYEVIEVLPVEVLKNKEVIDALENAQGSAQYIVDVDDVKEFRFPSMTNRWLSVVHGDIICTSALPHVLRQVNKDNEKVFLNLGTASFRDRGFGKASEDVLRVIRHNYRAMIEGQKGEEMTKRFVSSLNKKIDAIKAKAEKEQEAIQEQDRLRAEAKTYVDLIKLYMDECVIGKRLEDVFDIRPKLSLEERKKAIEIYTSSPIIDAKGCVDVAKASEKKPENFKKRAIAEMLCGIGIRRDDVMAYIDSCCSGCVLSKSRIEMVKYMVKNIIEDMQEMQNAIVSHFDDKQPLLDRIDNELEDLI